MIVKVIIVNLACINKNLFFFLLIVQGFIMEIGTSKLGFFFCFFVFFLIIGLSGRYTIYENQLLKKKLNR